MAIVVGYYAFGGSCSDCSFFTACLRVITLAAILTAGVFLSSVHGYCVFCTVRAQAVLQTEITRVLVASSQ